MALQGFNWMPVVFKYVSWLLVWNFYISQYTVQFPLLQGNFSLSVYGDSHCIFTIYLLYDQKLRDSCMNLWTFFSVQHPVTQISANLAAMKSNLSTLLTFQGFHNQPQRYFPALQFGKGLQAKCRIIILTSLFLDIIE